MHRSLTAIAAVAALALPAAAATALPAEGHKEAAATPAGTFTNMDNFSGDERYADVFNQKIEWSAEACEKATTYPRPGRTYECAVVQAPLDWHNPEKGTIDVGIGRVLEYGDWNDETKTRRLLISNPGGPGGDGLNFGAVINQYIGAGESHTGIGIDPRGVGLSKNLQCTKPGAPVEGSAWFDGDSASFTYEEVMKTNEQLRADLKKCADDNAGWVEYVNTEQTARDFDLVRHLLGYETADIYGVSYGTWLGSTMEKMFPNSYDRVVLDGNLDWSGVTIEDAWFLQAQAFQAASDRQLKPFLSRHNDVYGLGETTWQVEGTLRDMRQAILEGKLGDDVTVDSFDMKHAMNMYSQHQFHGVGMLFKSVKAALAGDEEAREAVRAQLIDDGDFGPSDSVFMTLKCADNRIERGETKLFKENEANAKNLPLLGPAFVFDFCGGWPHKPAFGEEIMKRPVSEVLMLQNEGDPATGYAGGREARYRAAGNVRMMAVDDLPGHGLPGLDNDCAAEAVTGYLVNGVFPKGDIHCQAGPITSGPVTDEKVYEYEMAASEAQPLPRTRGYIMRNFSEPTVDVKATEAAESETRMMMSKRSDLDMDASELYKAITHVPLASSPVVTSK